MKAIFKTIVVTLALLLFILAVGIVFMSSEDISTETIKERYCDNQSQFIEVNGINVHYKTEGKGDTLVLIHGTAASLHTWDNWVSILKDSFTLVRFDLQAFGVTGPNKTGDYSLNSYLDFTTNLLDKLKLDKFHLAGNSLGGRIAWNYTALNPDKVKSLILLDASGFPSDEVPFVFKLAQSKVLSGILKKVTPEAFIEKNLIEVYHVDTKVTEDLVSRYHDMALREGNRQAFIDRANSTFESKVDRLNDIKCPTLILWGQHDLWTPVADAYKFDKHIENSTLHILENSGHVPMEESPIESSDALVRFLSKFSNRASYTTEFQ